MRVAALLVGMSALGVSAASAQDGFATPAGIIGGLQARGYSFASGLPITSVRQFAFPVAVVFPVGKRLSVDIGTSYASTRVDSSGSGSTFSGFTDTQIRASYVFGTDRVVTTLMVNLPTGKKTSLANFRTGAVASNFLQFPVNSYRNGASVTGGLAVAGQAGQWNIGAAGSLRVSGEYEPFTDAGSAFSYKPGVEGRLRLGLDRLVGSSRLATGFTFSTFSSDEFSGTAATTGSYRPGNRYIAEASLTTPVRSAALTWYIWNYYRDSKDTTSASQVSSEDVVTAGLSARIPLGARVSLQPLVEGRLWYPDQGRGNLFGLGSSLHVAVAPQLSFVPGGRVDLGRLRSGSGRYHRIHGWEVTGLLRYDI